MNKKFNKELSKGGWKIKDKLFEIKEDYYPITVLYKNGDTEDALWHYSQNWVESFKFDDFSLWSEKRTDTKGWFETLMDKIRG